MMKPFAAVASVCLPLAAHVSAQPATDSLAQNTYEIGFENGRITGPGGDLLLRLGEQAQFVAIGEEHNNADIPPFVGALFRELHDKAGYNYLADEQDAVITRLVSQPPMRGSVAAIEAQARAEKHSFTFNSDEELRLIADIGRISTGKGRPVWGCEQVFGATHVLERILPDAPTPAARSLARDLLDEAQTRETFRDDKLENRFLIDPEAARKVAKLQQAYAPVRDAETKFSVDALAKSFEIYHYFWNGDHQSTPGYFSNSAVREEHMKQLCRDEYLRAAKLDGRPPKAILKFGHWHIFQTNAPSTVPTLGVFMADIARLNGKGLISIAFMSREYDGSPLWSSDENKAYAAFAPALQKPGWVLIDLRPLREYPVYRALLASAGADVPQAAKDSFRRLVYGFDFALVMDRSRPGHFTKGQRSDVAATRP